jgi:hypothetical protein
MGASRTGGRKIALHRGNPGAVRGAGREERHRVTAHRTGVLTWPIVVTFLATYQFALSCSRCRCRCRNRHDGFDNDNDNDNGDAPRV